MSEPKRPNVYGISRDLWEHPVFAKEPYTEAQAWAWLIGAAAWKTINARGNVGALTLHRGEFSFSVRFLAEKWLWKKDKVHRYLGKLKKHDMLRDSERDGNAVFNINNYNRFQIIGLPKRDTSATGGATAPRQDRDKEETGETGETKTGAAAPKAQPALDLGFQFPTWWPVEAWEGYLAMRKKRKNPATDRAIELVVIEITKLRELGHDPVAVLDRSTLKGWTDVYPLPGNEAGARAAGGAGAGVPGSIKTTTMSGWVGRLEVFHHGDEDVAKGFWARDWGPQPGQPGCAVPPEAETAYKARSGPRRASG